jgi:hypothetical protein
MITRKMKLFSAAIAVAALIAAPALVRAVHKEGAPVYQAHARAQGQEQSQGYQGYDVNPVVGPDGKLIGAAPDPSVRSQLQQDGLPE